jgi:hypothetical protein
MKFNSNNPRAATWPRDWVALIGGLLVLLAQCVYAASWYISLSSAAAFVVLVELLGWVLALGGPKKAKQNAVLEDGGSPGQLREPR